MSRAFLPVETLVIHTWESLGKLWRVTVVSGLPRLEEKCGQRFVMAKVDEESCALLDGALHAYVAQMHVQFHWAKSEQRACEQRGNRQEAMRWATNANTVVSHLERMPAPWNRMPTRERK